MKKVRGLVLSDVIINPGYVSIETTVDYLCSEHGIQVISDTVVTSRMRRDVDYDVLLISEYDHFVYALPTSKDEEPPYIRIETNAGNELDSSDVACCNAEVTPYQLPLLVYMFKFYIPLNRWRVFSNSASRMLNYQTPVRDNVSTHIAW